MSIVKKGVAALAVTVALSGLTSPSYAQDGGVKISQATRAGHSRVQPQGRPLSPVPLGQHGNFSVPRLHDRTWPAGITGLIAFTGAVKARERSIERGS